MEIIGKSCKKLKNWVLTQIATHKAIVDAHHTKYTNTEAVAALSVADAYVKNIGDIVDGSLRVTGNLGVGNTTPSHKVHIEGTTGIRLAVIGNTSSGQDNDIPQLLFNNKTTYKMHFDRCKSLLSENGFSVPEENLKLKLRNIQF